METTIIISVGVLIFAIFFVTFFREDIRKMLSRIQKIGKDGVSLKEPQAQSQDERPLPFAQQFDLYSRSPIQIEKEDQIRKELSERGLTNDEEKVKLLIRALATNIIQADCERISLLIFGSQLELLIEMNAHGQGMKIQHVEKWYLETIKTNYPALVNLPFEDYIGFLYRQGLAVIEADVVKVTNFGIEFMQYLVRTGQTHRRAN
jgi:hypothetical protein